MGVNSAISYAETSQAMPMSAIKLPKATKLHIHATRSVRDDEQSSSVKKIGSSGFSCAIS